MVLKCAKGGELCTLVGSCALLVWKCALLMGYCALLEGNCAFLVGNYALLMGNRADWVLRGAWKIGEETLPIGKAAESIVWRATVNMVVSRGVVQQWSNGPFTNTPTHTYTHTHTYIHTYVGRPRPASQPSASVVFQTYTYTHVHPYTHTPTLLFSYPFHGRGLPHTMIWLRLLLHSFLKRTEHTPPPSTGQ